MNPAYIETFSRHRRLFILPVVVTTIIALWFAFGTPKQYRASASLWAAAAPPAASSTPVNGITPTPAVQTQQLLAELLLTEKFRLTVGHRGPLAEYMAAHPTQGFGPQALLKKLRGSGTPDDRTLAALDSQHVFSLANGDHLVTLRVDGPTPAVAVRTLQALIDSFGDELDQQAVQRQQVAMALANDQRQAAGQAVSDLQRKIERVQSSNGSGYVSHGLIQSLQVAEKKLTRSTIAYYKAKLALTAAAKEKTTFSVKDAPKFPAPAIGGLKKSLFIVVAGLFAGALLSFVGIVFLTPDERKDDDAGLGGPTGETVSMEAVGDNGAPADGRSTAKAAGGGRFRR